MAGNERTVTIKFLGDASSAVRASDQVHGATGKTEGGLGKLIKTVGAIGVATGIASFGKSSVNAFKESEQANDRLQGALSKMPAAIRPSFGELDKLAGALQKKTKFDDEATKSAMANLATYGLTGDTIKSVTPTILDLASKLGIDAPSAADTFDKALSGSLKALKVLGIQGFKPTGDKARDAAVLQDMLNKKVGGFAEREGKSAAGQSEILKNQFGELQEKVGAALVPAMMKLADIGLKIIDFFQGLPGPVQIGIGVLAGLAITVGVIIKLQQAWVAVNAALNASFLANPIVLIIVVIVALIAAVILAYQHCETFRAIVDGAFHAIAAAGQWLWNTVLKPVFDGIVVAFRIVWTVAQIYIGIWVAIFRIAASIVQFLWGVVSSVFNVMSGFIGGVMSRIGAVITGTWGWVYGAVSGAVSGIWNTVVGTFSSMIGWFSGVPGRIAGIASGMWNGIGGAFRGVLNWIIDMWNRLHFTIPSVSFFGKTIGGGTIGVPQLPHFAQGGIVPGPIGMAQLAVVHGGERVLTPGQQGQGPTIILQISGVIGDKREVGRVAVEAITEYERRSGTRWRAS